MCCSHRFSFLANCKSHFVLISFYLLSCPLLEHFKSSPCWTLELEAIKSWASHRRLQWQLNLFPFKYSARNFESTDSTAPYSSAYKLFSDKSNAAKLGASSMKLGAMYFNSGLLFSVSVLRSFSEAKLPFSICVKWGHWEMDKNSVRTRVKSSWAENKLPFKIQNS